MREKPITCRSEGKLLFFISREQLIQLRDELRGLLEE